MLSLIKKSLIWIVSGTVSVILTACYGMPAGDYQCYGEQKKVKAVDPNNDPIPGLLVTSELDDAGLHTGADGTATLEVFCNRNILVTVEDVDGSANGSYFTKTVSVEVPPADEIEIIVMEPGEPGEVSPDSDAIIFRHDI